MGFNWADWVIVLVLVVSSIISLKRGFVKELLSLVIWVVAFVVARLFSPEFASHFEEYTSNQSTQEMAAFAALFITTLLLGSAVSYLLSSLVKVAGLSNADRVFGVVFGFARGALIVLVFVLYAPLESNWEIDRKSWWQQSSLIPHFLSMEESFHGGISTVSGWFAMSDPDNVDVEELTPNTLETQE